MGKSTSSLLVALLLCGTAEALATAAGAEVETRLIVSSQPVAPGQASQLTVVLVNPGERAVSVALEPALACRLDSPTGAFLVRAEARSAPDDAASTVPPGGSAEHDYAFTVPEDAAGTFAFGCDGVGAPPTLLQVEAGEAEGGALREGVQEFTSGFATFEPFYFLVGVDPSESKFQISFDYRVLNPKAPLAELYPWLTGFHFAYTQTSLWDLESESAPFRDTSYKPEFHFLSPRIPWNIPWLDDFRIRLGYQHESNGRDGPDSRSTNFVYAKPILAFSPGEPWLLEVAPKAWLYVANDDRTNDKLPDYRGYFDLELNLTRLHSVQLATHLRWAQEGGTVQVDLTYPLAHLFFGNFDLYFQAQYFNGYAETLLRFDRREQAIRLGLAMLR